MILQPYRAGYSNEFGVDNIVIENVLSYLSTTNNIGSVYFIKKETK